MLCAAWCTGNARIPAARWSEGATVAFRPPARHSPPSHSRRIASSSVKPSRDRISSSMRWNTCLKRGGWAGSELVCFKAAKWAQVRPAGGRRPVAAGQRRSCPGAPPGRLARCMGPTCFRLSSNCPAAKAGCRFSSSGIRLEQKRATSGPPWPSNTPKMWQSSLRCSAMCASSCRRGAAGRPLGASAWAASCSLQGDLRHDASAVGAPGRCSCPPEGLLPKRATRLALPPPLHADDAIGSQPLVRASNALLVCVGLRQILSHSLLAALCALGQCLEGVQIELGQRAAKGKGAAAAALRWAACSRQVPGARMLGSGTRGETGCQLAT